MTALVSQVAGVFASPASRQPMGPMMRAAFADLGYDIDFLTCDVAPLRLGDAVAGARAMGWLGFVVGDPHKRAIVTQVDGLAESAAAIGAATCAARRGDAFVGENTEGWAVVEAIEAHVDPDGCRAVVFGAGQAGRAVAVELARAGAAQITIVNRTGLRAMQAAALMRGMEGLDLATAEWQDTFRIPPTTDVVVNATTVGRSSDGDDRLDIDPESLSGRMVVVDMVPRATPTLLVKEAMAAGCAVIDGADVVAGQGALAIRLWTNADANLAVMREALLPTLARMA